MATSAGGRRIPKNVEEEMDSIIQQIMKCQNISGMAVTAYEKGERLYHKLFGKADRVTGRPMDNNTLLALASVSKGMSCATAAYMQQEYHSIGWNWNAKIRKFLGKNFWQTDWTRTNELTLRDVVSHNSGIPRHDNMWFVADFNREEILRRMPYMNASVDFRSGYKYNNLLYLYLEESMKKATGQSYPELVQKYLFNPLGITDSFFVGDTKLPWGRVGQAYILIPGNTSKLVPVSRKLMEMPGRTQSAGGILIKLDEMARYVSHLSNMSTETVFTGTYTGDPLLSVLAPVIPVINEPVYQPSKPEEVQDVKYPSPPFTRETYAKGWSRGFYRDRLVFVHGGSMLGHYGAILWDPKANIAIYLNGISLIGPNHIPSILYINNLPLYILDRLLGKQTWLNKNNTCEYFTPSSPIKTSHTFTSWPVHQEMQKTSINLDPSVLKSMKGIYGNYAFGNLTIDWFTVDKQLKLIYSPWGNMSLIPVKRTSNSYVFQARLPEEIFYLTQGLISITVNINAKSGQGETVEADILEPEVKPIFWRNMRLDSYAKPKCDPGEDEPKSGTTWTPNQFLISTVLLMFINLYNF